jgi:galactokinase
MDQLTSAAGVAGHALLIDFCDETFTPVALPEGVEVRAVHSGESRALVGSAYAERRSQCEQAAEVVGPLRDASIGDLGALTDPVVRRRARHVVTENVRTRAFAAALTEGDLGTAGAVLAEGHMSLRDDFAVSTPALDALVDRLQHTPGVIGARLTGGGFGGCAVALCEPGALDEGWRLEPSAGARLLDRDDED